MTGPVPTPGPVTRQPRPRFVAARARGGSSLHAVYVPDDLPAEPRRILSRTGGRAPLILNPRWTGKAECGQVVRGIVAGPNGGHDWDRVPVQDRALCPRCLSKMERTTP